MSPTISSPLVLLLFVYHILSVTPVSPFATFPQTLGLPAMPPDPLTADAFRVADLSAADGVVVLLVAHQRVHAQNGWREQGQGVGVVTSPPPSSF